MILLIALLGLCVGSFLNVVIHRLRTGETGWRSRSRCPSCHAVLRASDLVPLASFVVLRGRCRSCRKPISWQYPLVEAATMGLFVAAYLAHGGIEGLADGAWFAFIRDVFFLSVLAVVFVIDHLDMTIYDAVVLPAAAAAFASNLLLGVPWPSLLLGAAVGGGFFLLQYALSRGRWIGGGDIRLGLMIGALLGFPKILAALFLAYVAGALAATVLLAFGRKRWSSQLAFGTFLSAAAAAVLLAGERLIAWYASLLS